MTDRSGADPRLHVYGVLAGSPTLPAGLPAGVGEPSAPVRTIESDGLAAVVSEVPAGWEAATRADVETHGRILEQLIAHHTVVPLRFGMVMTEQEVRDELLARHRARITGLLRDLDGRVQMSVKAYYGPDALLRQALRAHPDLKRRSDALEGQPPERTQGERIALGQEVARAVEEQRALDERTLVEPLSKLVRDLRVEPAAGERVAASLQLLIDRARRGEVDEAVRRLTQAHADRFAIRYVGPLPPYSFADLSLAPAEGAWA